MKHIVLLLCLMAMPINSYAGELFRWIDKSGNVHYGDAPAIDATLIERMKFSTKQDVEYLPYETRLAQQNFPVTLYMTENCNEPCQLARDLLNKRGIPFTEKILLTQKELDDFKQQTGSNQAPTLAVGKKYLSGFQAEQWNSELDITGYPKALLNTSPPAPVKNVEGKPTAAK